MTGPAMEIHLQESAQPCFVSTARAITYTWREEGQQLLQRMKRQGIIAAVSANERRTGNIPSSLHRKHLVAFELVAT